MKYQQQYWRRVFNPILLLFRDAIINVHIFRSDVVLLSPSGIQDVN